MRTPILVLAAIAATFVTPAASAVPATVTLDVSILADAIDYAVCEVPIGEDADGFDVLDAAVATGCIDSYEASDSSFGRYLECVDGICGEFAPIPAGVYAGSYWSVSVDDAPSMVGLDDLEVAFGSEIGLTYLAYAFPA